MARSVLVPWLSSHELQSQLLLLWCFREAAVRLPGPQGEKYTTTEMVNQACVSQCVVRDLEDTVGASLKRCRNLICLDERAMYKQLERHLYHYAPTRTNLTSTDRHKDKRSLEVDLFFLASIV